MYVLYVKENSERNLDFLSIPQSGGKMSKRLGGIIGCKDKIASWPLNRFPDDNTVVVVVVVSHIQRIGCQPEKNYFTRWPIPLVVC